MGKPETAWTAYLYASRIGYESSNGMRHTGIAVTLPNASIIIGIAEAADMTCVTESAWVGGNFNTALLQKIPLCMRLGIRGAINSLGEREF